MRTLQAFLVSLTLVVPSFAQDTDPCTAAQQEALRITGEISQILREGFYRGQQVRRSERKIKSRVDLLMRKLSADPTFCLCASEQIESFIRSVLQVTYDELDPRGPSQSYIVLLSEVLLHKWSPLTKMYELAGAIDEGIAVLEQEAEALRESGDVDSAEAIEEGVANLKELLEAFEAAEGAEDKLEAMEAVADATRAFFWDYQDLFKDRISETFFLEVLSCIANLEFLLNGINIQAMRAHIDFLTGMAKDPTIRGGLRDRITDLLDPAGAWFQAFPEEVKALIKELKREANAETVQLLFEHNALVNQLNELDDLLDEKREERYQLGHPSVVKAEIKRLAIISGRLFRQAVKARERGNEKLFRRLITRVVEIDKQIRAAKDKLELIEQLTKEIDALTKQVFALVDQRDALEAKRKNVEAMAEKLQRYCDMIQGSGTGDGGTGDDSGTGDGGDGGTGGDTNIPGDTGDGTDGDPKDPTDGGTGSGEPSGGF